jgi:hypothetical protein
MLITLGNRQVHMTDAQFDALEMLKLANGGGFATVHGYKPTTDYVKIPTVNIQFRSKFSTVKLYQRRLAALGSVAFDDLVLTAPKLLALTKLEQQKQFLVCQTKMLESHTLTIDDVREDAHRQGHDRCHAPVCTGVKVHLFTEKRDDGLMHPILADDGNPTMSHVKLSALITGRTTIVEGEKKIVNSGPKVLMDHAIEKAWEKKMDKLHGKCHGKLAYVTLSLKADNHDHIRIGGEIMDADMHAASLDYVEDDA